jgi:hypothetical protein
MKHSISVFLVLHTLLAASAFGQAEIDKPIVLTGSGADARITGIETISQGDDAVHAEAVQNGSLVFAVSGGAADAYAISVSPAPGAYTAGQLFHFLSHAGNTGAATLDINGLGPISLKKHYDEALDADDIRAGQVVTVIFDGQHFQVLSPLGSSSSGGGGSPSGGKEYFYCTKADQFFTVPAGVTGLNVKLWGAGGGGGNYNSASTGGGGAFVGGSLAVSPGQSLRIIVGEGGNSTGTVTYGGGGNGRASGGGRSAIQVSGADVVTAGGGGGGGSSQTDSYAHGGGGGATTGADGVGSQIQWGCFGTEGGRGGTVSAGGAGGSGGSCGGNPGRAGSPGTLYTGGNVSGGGQAGGGGGGGYYGGGAGDSNYGGGGGGGSSYPASGFTISAGSTRSGGSPLSSSPAGGTGDADYLQGIGTGGLYPTPGGNGLVILSW